MKDAPKFGVNSDDEVCEFTDGYITCCKPQEDGLLKELVSLLQEHKHCKKGKTCRFHFPQLPNPKTLIAYSADPDIVRDAQSTLGKVHKVLIEGNIPSCLDELLQNTGIMLDTYMEALGVSNRGNTVVLKCTPEECKINNYNKDVILAWQAIMY